MVSSRSLHGEKYVDYLINLKNFQSTSRSVLNDHKQLSNPHEMENSTLFGVVFRLNYIKKPSV